ncbi:MAG: flagellar filament capping protein FliD [Desulfovibrionaceae bacterium]|nr:flagellar filament capping protein FliD [Desulfovibrionaceae bacterium]
MAIYGSGSIRFSGLGNDTNFDEMIGKLAKIESRQVNQLMRWRSDWQTRLEGFKQVRGELMNMQSALNKLNSLNKFMAKTASSSDDRVATAVADADSLDSTYALKVDNLAKAYTWSQDTGLYHKTDVICSQDGGGIFEYTYQGKTRTITVPKNTTAEGLVKLINNDSNNPGARAQLIQTGDGITFQIYGKDTGKSNTLVIRDTSGLTLNTALDGETYHEEVNMVQLMTASYNPTDNINPGTENKTFIYTVDSQRYTVTVTPDMTMDGLISAINARHPGLASLAPKYDEPTGSDRYFTLSRPDTNYSFAGNANFDSFVGSANQFATPDTDLNTGSTDITLSFVINNSDNANQITKNVTITPGMTLSQFRKALENEVGAYGTVSLKQDTGSGQWYVDVTQKPTVHRVTVEDGTLEDFAYKVPSDKHWDVVRGENAKIKVNGWPGGENTWFESASNTIAAGTIVEGISFNLLKEGDTIITTRTDTEKIKENIEAFVDAVNSFRIVLKALSEVDKEKATYDPKYAESQFEMQKGSVLTGNYGIQTIASRLKNAIASQAIGFTSRQYASDGAFLGGDIFSSLSQIGISTNAEQGSTFFGLLEINYISGEKGAKSLDDALRDDPMAVAKLFAAKNEGFTDSASFGYNSQISGTTKAGNYSVRYTCTEDGKIDKAWVNGEEASIDHEKNQITSVSGPSKGLVLDIYPHSLVAGSDVSGTVSLREGKVNELLSMLDGSEGMLGTSGTLRNLERNYQDIIDNIEKKISREDERLAKWERTMINKFARLDAVLARYNQLNEGLQAQIAQLGANNKK